MLKAVWRWCKFPSYAVQYQQYSLQATEQHVAVMFVDLYPVGAHFGCGSGYWQIFCCILHCPYANAEYSLKIYSFIYLFHVLHANEDQQDVLPMLESRRFCTKQSRAQLCWLVRVLLNKIFVRFIWLTKDFALNYYYYYCYCCYLPHQQFHAFLMITVCPATIWWRMETCVSLCTESTLIALSVLGECNVKN
jgi:hypothetical protein